MAKYLLVAKIWSIRDFYNALVILAMRKNDESRASAGATATT